MKNKHLILLTLTLAAITPGCKQPDDNNSTVQNIDKLKTETKEAARDLKEKDYTFQQKAEFSDKMKAQLAEINQNLDQLEAKIEKSSDSIKADAKPKLLAMREHKTQLDKQLDQVQNATESTWDNVKSGASKAYDTMKDDFQKSRQWMSDKIAP